MSRKKTLGVSLAAAAAIAILLAAYTLATPALTPVASKEGLALKGVVDIVVKDANGNIKYQKTLQNTITADGYTRILIYSFNTTSTKDTLFNSILVQGTDDADNTVIAVFKDGSPSVTQDSDTKSHATIDVTFKVATNTFVVPTGYNTIKVSQDPSTFTPPVSITLLKLQDQQEESPIVFSTNKIPAVGLQDGDQLTITWTIYAQAPS
jgi:hypothetical protein